ncbi:Transcription factor MBP1 [Candida viswanathii]|uniref:Transcription factor MBP1 n=1 Tax=Candida viswanathii TaxID=5486 RepID=A0A367YIQ8_9ASCO|nr:Transcription factor MBP1 [Candida viswanathii]
MSSTQIYSATYSSVPVFEFVTSEGPIMRRKLDSWINATHILKIAKFPKARRTRILEKDVQTGIHEKVQGGYGKYQGTYVPLELGASIAKNFGVYEVLKPIFEFKYIEGETEVPPPAPKHNHASALNLAKREALLLKKQKGKQVSASASSDDSSGTVTGHVPKKRGRPKRPTLSATPSLLKADTTPIEQSFNSASARPSYAGHLPSTLSRQDTEQDALQIMTNNMNLRQEDLASVDTDDDEEDSSASTNAANGNGGGFTTKRRKYPASMAANGNGLESQADLLTSKELFGVSRTSFEKRSNQQHNNYLPLQPYQQPSITLSQENQIYSEYFQSLLSYFLEDSNKIRSQFPDKLANPPLPLSKIHINQSIDAEGNTMFHWACSMGNLMMVEFLMKTFTHEINPTVRNNKGETPLMFMVKYNNAFQLRNFPQILDILADSILLVDSNGKTVLHHIVDADNKHKKEKFTRYYMESLFERLVDDKKPEGAVNNGNGEDDEDDLPATQVDEDAKNELVSKFINHQDSNGNTAFHIAAYNLNKKCIKVFITYHRFLNFGLRNLVSCTVEDYLASHNYVLRLDPTENDDQLDGQEDDDVVEDMTNENQSFETQLHNSKTAINLQNSTANLLTEKMTQLAYAIDSELSDKDEIILSYFKILNQINETKLESQRKILSFFKLDHLIDELEQSKESSQDSSDDTTADNLYLDFKRDHIVQEEIYRLMNDLTYQSLHEKDKLETLQKSYKNIRERLHSKSLERAIPNESPTNNIGKQEEFELTKELQLEIIKRKQLLDQILKQSKDVPVAERESSKSIINQYSTEDKLYKYCKLISLSCGMQVEEIEGSIDAIEESLVKNR